MPREASALGRDRRGDRHASHPGAGIALQPRGERADPLAQDRRLEENRRCAEPAHGGGSVTVVRTALTVVLALTLLAAPRAADGQQAGKVYRIGYLTVPSRETAGAVANLHHIIKFARQEGTGVAAVDGCLRLAAVRADGRSQNVTITGVAHLFYHWNNVRAQCSLPDKAGFLAELRGAAGHPFVDLVAHSMTVRWSYPAFIWMLEPEELFDVVMGRVMIFAQFDIQDFIGRIEALGFKTSWVTSKQSAETKSFGGPIPGSPNAWALCVETGDFRMDYLVGFFGRLFTELMTPGDLLRMVRADIWAASPRTRSV